MTHDLDPIKLGKKLIEIYERYLVDSTDEENKGRALRINIDYDIATDFVDDRLAIAISELVYLAADDPGRYVPDRETIASYIQGLRQLIAELESKQ